MIKIMITGGLGNQMFQYAMGRATALRNKTELYLDTSWYGNHRDNTARKFDLNKFNIKSAFSPSHTHFIVFLRKIIIKLGLIKVTKEKMIFKFDPSLLHTENIYLQGYWQNENYFKDFIQNIREDFTLKDKPSEKFIEVSRKIDKSNSVAIHIRRGDYASDNETNSFHGLCSIDYYEKAISIIESKIEDPFFFIFSDDINWTRKILHISSNIEWVSDYKLEDIEDLLLLSKCKHQIIANSSFSWWGAYLNDNINKIVIAPNKWIKSANYNTDGIIPPSWIKI